ncbi:MCE family protein [Haloechinothrix sp. YIM 98757]|uniref:MCE family protein n=1 Tax=Haloechinothrix aidingensis TaxID=2752311 RepID=A0A838ACJ5_9PSEU|nr:MCE family protein [Haloechinothrix aidingensis]MBA0126960.1 MCE family protein [Haloechinothrix aidingensis]
MSRTRRKVLLARLRYQALGVALLVVIVLFFGVTVGIYNKAFTTAATVSLETGHVGNQMRPGADVKVRGVVVGEVSEISARADGATLELALRPEQLELVPANVQARLLPKTLFGERYVALQLPEGRQLAGDGVEHISDGATISQDRSENAIELEQVLGNVMPLLQAVEPQKLSSALNSVATALDGRGEDLGETLVLLSEYLGEFNHSLPDLEENLKGLADVSEIYSEAAPDFLQALSTATTTTQTIAEKSGDLTDLYRTVVTSSNDMRSFIDVNRDNLIDLTATAQPTLDVLEKYAPQYPCMLRQFANQMDSAGEAFRDGKNWITIEFISSRGKYEPGKDEPRYEDKRGPRCYPQVERPEFFPQYPPDGPIADGSTKPPPPNEPDGSEAADYEDYDDSGDSSSSGSSAPAGRSIANSPMEQRLLSLLAAPAVEGSPADVPDWASLLIGPLYRGAKVEVR